MISKPNVSKRNASFDESFSDKWLLIMRTDTIENENMIWQRGLKLKGSVLQPDSLSSIYIWKGLPVIEFVVWSWRGAPNIPKWPVPICQSKSSVRLLFQVHQPFSKSQLPSNKIVTYIHISICNNSHSDLIYVYFIYVNRNSNRAREQNALKILSLPKRMLAIISLILVYFFYYYNQLQWTFLVTIHQDV